MSFVKVADDGPLITNYTLRTLKRDTESSWPADTFSNPVYLGDLAAVGVYPVRHNRPPIEDNEILVKDRLVIIDGEYVQQYTVRLKPSMLEGGTRHPTSAELDANKPIARLYYRNQLEQLLDGEAGLFGFGETVFDQRARSWVFKGKIANVSAYVSNDRGNPWRDVAQVLERWRHRVWATAQTQENSWLHPTSPTEALTWDQLRALLPDHGLTPPEQ